MARPSVRFLFFILTTCPLPAADKPAVDWDAIRREIPPIFADNRDVQKDMRAVERVYAKLGYPLKIDHPRELFHYQAPLGLVTVPDEKLPLLFRDSGYHGPRTRRDYFLHLARGMDCQSMPFDPAKWKSPGPLRYRLIKGFLRDRKIVGQKPAEIQKHLGRPTDAKADSFSYLLGPSPTSLGPVDIHIRFHVKAEAVTGHEFFNSE